MFRGVGAVYSDAVFAKYCHPHPLSFCSFVFVFVVDKFVLIKTDRATIHSDLTACHYIFLHFMLSVLHLFGPTFGESPDHTLQTRIV